jgi:signal transduction histidine kinase
VLSHWPIRYKLMFGTALLCVIVATLSITSFHGIYTYRQLVRGISCRAAELEPASRLTAAVSELRFTLRQILTRTDFSGQPRSDAWVMRESFEANLISVKSALESYHDALRGSDAEDPFIGDKQQEYETVQQIRYCLANITGLKNETDWVLEPVVSDELEKELVMLADLSGKLPNFLRDKMRTFRDEARGLYHTWTFLNWSATILTVIGLFGLMQLFNIWILKPIRTLIAGSRCVVAGDFSHRIHLDTRDEVAELASAMNAMTERFQQIRDDLDAQVQQRTKEVVRSEQMASVGFLAAGVAHEINNPLASIAWAAESLESRVQDLWSEEDEDEDEEKNGEKSHEAEPNPDVAVLRKYLRRIQDEAFRCKGITERLLDFSRIGDLKRHDTNLREVVEGVIDMVRHLGKHRRKEITFACHDSVLVSANAQEMKQVVLNIVTNALDSLDQEGTVRIDLRRDMECAALTVADNGCGMTEEVQKHLYEPFFTRRRGGQGTGLGLSITYRIVTDHGGQIQAFSEGPGKGSRITVKLPLVQHEEKNQRQHAA